MTRKLSHAYGLIHQRAHTRNPGVFVTWQCRLGYACGLCLHTQARPVVSTGVRICKNIKQTLDKPTKKTSPKRNELDFPVSSVTRTQSTV